MRQINRPSPFDDVDEIGGFESGKQTFHFPPRVNKTRILVRGTSSKLIKKSPNQIWVCGNMPMSSLGLTSLYGYFFSDESSFSPKLCSLT